MRFERTGSGGYQLGGFFLERDDTGGAALGGMVTAPTTEPATFLSPPSGARPRAMPVDEARARIEKALARTAELGLAVERECGVCLPLIAVGLTGRADGLPTVDVELDDPDLDDPPDGERGPLYVDPLDEDAYLLVEQGLLTELEDYVDDEDEPFVDHAAFFAGSLLHWKWGYADGRLGTWNGADLAEYMLDYAPRKLPADDETLAAAPGCIALFLSFLADRGSLSGDLDDLRAELERLAPQLDEAARDPANWGPAKSLISQMESEGVDPTEEGALDAWDGGLQLPATGRARPRPRRSDGPDGRRPALVRVRAPGAEAIRERAHEDAAARQAQAGARGAEAQPRVARERRSDRAATRTRTMASPPLRILGR